MKEIVRLPFEHYLKLIKDNKPFFLSRYGDGEVIAMFNPDFFKEKKFEHLDVSWHVDYGEKLKSILMNFNDGYYHCFLNGTLWSHGVHPGEKFIEFLNSNCEEAVFYDGEIWQNASGEGKISQLIDAINPYDPVFIGGKHLGNLKYVNGMSEKMQHIVIEDYTAYYQHDYIVDEIMKKYESGSRMFCSSASAPGKIIIDELYPIIGKESFMIDFGSLWDPYCGILSRAGMRATGFGFYQSYTKMKLG